MDLLTIKELIPHREPFLWVDKVIDLQIDSAKTEKTIPEDLEVFQGHYPGNPIMPGVLICEAVFQTGALLMSHSMQQSSADQKGTPVLTRIENAKFKRMVQPGDTLSITVTLKETVTSVSFFKGKVTVNDKVCLIVDFACAVT